MATSPIVTRGYGSGLASIALVTLAGYASAAVIALGDMVNTETRAFGLPRHTTASDLPLTTESFNLPNATAKSS